MRNKTIQAFDINLLSIKKDVEIFEYQIDREFFVSFEQDLVSDGLLKIVATVNKTHSMITINLKVNGSIKLECDRSLEVFDYPINLKTDVFYKYGEENLELDLNLFQIENNTINLNIAEYLMELILVEIPIRKLHPKFRNEEIIEDDEPYFQTDIEQDKEEEKEIDPRWSALEKLKNKS